MNAPIIVLPFAVAGEYTARYSEPDKIAFGLDKAENWPVPFWITDVSMACQNLLLLLEERGLGALYFGVSRNADACCTPSSACPTGRRAPASSPSVTRSRASSRAARGARRRRRPLSDMVHHQRW